MKLILFGAGASYGSSRGNVPPMGAGLFSELRRFNPPGWGALPSDMASEFEHDFERGMAQLAQTRSHDMPILQRAMAVYFFNYLPTQDSLYVQLGKLIKQSAWRGAIATLNYERLLEISLIHAGLQPVVNMAPSLGQVELCLPHGCCHLFCEGVQASSVGVSFSGVGVTFDGPVIALSDPTQFRNRIESNSVPPVMSYFEPQKTTSSGASFIRNQRARWAELANQADTIIIVGVRVRPRDSHIWDAVAKSHAKVVFCAGKSAGAEFETWASAQRIGKGNRTLSGYFSEEFNAICEEAGLS